ncbi:cupin domain-containing protein [Paenibacillus sp. S-38]|uniref:cupin domain-containing protein n=1 Tax=Paenibacillus sp. S-38 TaxID=3416710 RepID=UPI003CF623F6
MYYVLHPLDPYHAYVSRSPYPYEWMLRHPFYFAYPPVPHSWRQEDHIGGETASDPGSFRPEAIKDHGPRPFVVNIEKAAERNTTYRTALWTGGHLQVTLMSIPAGSDIGLEVHPHTDQFLRIEEGNGLVQMGDSRDKLDFQARAHEDFAIMVPAGKWHNVTNTGNKPLKLYAIYAPPQHPHGTVHPTKAAAMASEGGG